MNLYDIDSAMTALIDSETGEVMDYDAFEALSMERDQKIDNLALWIKNLDAEQEALDREAKAMTERRDAARRKRDRLKGYLQEALHGEKRSTPQYAVSYRRSEVCEITDEEAVATWLYDNGRQDLLNTKVSVSKAGVKDLLKQGVQIRGAELTEKQNMSIK